MEGDIWKILFISALCVSNSSDSDSELTSLLNEEEEEGEENAHCTFANKYLNPTRLCIVYQSYI